MTHPDDNLESLVSDLPAALAAERVANARAEAVRMQNVLDRVADGPSRLSRRAALAAEFPGKAIGNLLTRLKRFENHGVRGLLNAYLPTPRVVLTPDVRARIQGMASLDPDVTTDAIVAALARSGVQVGASTIDEFRREAGIARPRGRRPGRSGGTNAEPLAAAGALLMVAAEVELGAVAALTTALGEHLEALPEPLDEPLDDRAHRDENGRFLSAYNATKERTSPEVGAKFETASRRAGEKDLREMRAANSSFDARYRKDLTLTLLPIFVETARWSSLRHWQGDHLAGVVGIAYQPSTLDKYARELKLAGASAFARSAVGRFWMGEATAGGAADALAIVYVDGSTKPVWTRTFSKCARVSSHGRTMPATTTMMLHSGSGTPLLFRSYSGAVSLPHEVTGLLREVEGATGAGTVRRLVVIDREGHSVAFFKELTARGWSFVVPLRSQVTARPTDFEQTSDWRPYGDSADEVCDAVLTLKDGRAGEQDLRIRVVGRRRGRTGKVFWLATSVVVDDFDATSVMRIYFDRWPLQEHVFRDGKGRVGLDVHHGYGKAKVTNYAIVDALDRSESEIRRSRAALDTARRRVTTLSSDRDDALQAEQALAGDLAEARAALQEARAREAHASELLSLQEGMLETHEALQQVGAHLRSAEPQLAAARDDARTLEPRLEALVAKHEAQQRQREIFTVDVELDEIMTSYKLTFMNLARHVMERYLGERMELDTLIRSVLTLPGERVRTPTQDLVRIYAQERDPETMALVEAACARVSELGLVRDQRKLRFELVTGPGRGDS